MHGFYIKRTKGQKFWIKLTQDLTVLLKVFSILASRESLVMTLNYFQSFFVFQWSLNYAFSEIIEKVGSNHIWRCFWFSHWQKLPLQPLATLLNYADLVYKLFITFWKCHDTQTLFILENI